MKTVISNDDRLQQSNAFSSLLLRTLLAALGVGTATAGLLILGVFSLVIV